MFHQKAMSYIKKKKTMMTSGGKSEIINNQNPIKVIIDTFKKYKCQRSQCYDEEQISLFTVSQIENVNLWINKLWIQKKWINWV